MPKLLLKFETAVLKEIPLVNPVATLGRKPDNDIVLDHVTVSSHHCKFFESGGSWFVEDLNSTNGTLVNGKKILKAGLKAKDTVSISKYSLIFMETAPAQAAAPAKPEPKPAETPDEKTLPPQKQAAQGILEVLEGGADGKSEYSITKFSTYIGKTPQSDIHYKGSGLFNAGPDNALVIALRAEGFFLIPIKEDYAMHNGVSLKAKVQLSDDDIINVGATKFRFLIKKPQ